MTNRIRLLVVRFHECRKKVGKGKVRIVIELDVLKSWKGKEWGDTASAITYCLMMPWDPALFNSG